MTQLSAHFTLEELTRSDRAVSEHIKNEPPAHVLPLVMEMCDRLLEKIRRRFGAIAVPSGYRCAELTVLINPNTAGTTDHTWDEHGVAVDIVPLKANIQDVFKWIVACELPYDQCILEYHVDKSTGKKSPRCIHLGYRPNNRQQAKLGETYGAGPYKTYVVGMEVV